ncbi:MAG: zf-TFIIB domain-containing protein [Planctomycetota bacterium]
MKCPVCDLRLSRVTYARTNVQQCTDCLGLLLPNNRVKTIERRVDKELEQLREEIRGTPNHDTLAVLRCPQCQARMTKIEVKDFGFQLDECDPCQLTWFDPRELALLQLAFESRPQRLELNAMRERLKNMTATERAEYERRLSKLKDRGSPFQQAVRGATLDLLRSGIFF